MDMVSTEELSERAVIAFIKTVKKDNKDKFPIREYRDIGTG